MTEGTVVIKFDEKRLQSIQKMLRDIPRAMPKVMSGAINKTATSARTGIVRRIIREVNVVQKSIRNKIEMEKATYSRWQAKLGISRKRISLISFKGTSQIKKGIRYRIKPGGARKLITSAFIGTPRRTGVAGILKRMTPRRYPLAWLRGPSLGQVFEGAPGVVRQVTESAYKKLEKNIDSQISRILSRRR